MAIEIDEIDTQILYLLQEDARRSAIDIAEEVGVSDNTVHNRMASLEDAGVIQGYSAEVEPRQAGFQFYFHFTCTTSISDRAEVAEQVISFPEVVEVTELMTGQENLHVRVVGKTDRDITRMAQRLDELALEINDENLIRDDHKNPIDITAIEQSR